VHPDRTGWDLAKAIRQLVQRDVLGLLDAAGRSMPMRTSSRWASATCAGDSPIRVNGVPQGMSQPR